MAVKEKLRGHVGPLAGQEAEDTLDFIARRGESFEQWLHSRPEDDEPLSDADRATLARSDADIATGDTVSFDQIKQELRRDAA